MSKKRRKAAATVAVVADDTSRPRTAQERRASERQRAAASYDHHLKKLQAGPDPTEAALAISPYRESEYMQTHHSVGSGKVAGDGTPAPRAEWLRYLDGTLLDTEEGQQRHERLEALRTSSKRSHRRAYSLLIAYYGGMTQAEIAEIAGAGGKRVTQQRVSQILKMGMRWISEPPLSAE